MILLLAAISRAAGLGAYTPALSIIRAFWVVVRDVLDFLTDSHAAVDGRYWAFLCSLLWPMYSLRTYERRKMFPMNGGDGDLKDMRNPVQREDLLRTDPAQLHIRHLSLGRVGKVTRNHVMTDDAPTACFSGGKMGNPLHLRRAKARMHNGEGLRERMEEQRGRENQSIWRARMPENA